MLCRSACMIPNMRAAAGAIVVWADMVKLAHSVFALPFAAIAAFLAGRNVDGRGWPYVGQLGLILICMVAARSTAMTFNRIVDAEIDARNPRTAGRPLPAGSLSRVAAYAMLILSVITFGVGCGGFYAIYANTWPIMLGGPLLAYLCLYSLTKRFTKWSHFVLGSAIALSPVAAWLAIHPESIGWSSVLLATAVTCWVGGFDIIYACQDIEADRREGLHSLPSRIGPGAALWVARASHACTVVALVALGMVERLGAVYAAGVAAAAVLLVVENSMVRPGDYRKVNVAFFTINGVVSIVLATATVVDIAI